MDGAKEETLGDLRTVYRAYCIAQHTSAETEYQNQNGAEQYISDIKRRTSILMALHDSPEYDCGSVCH
jgi:hypothetical protein